jgi:hypothetical protein
MLFIVYSLHHVSATLAVSHLLIVPERRESRQKEHL